MRTSGALLAIIALALSGCTTSLVSREQQSLPSGVRPGIAYRLPVLQYELKAKYTLAGCEADEGGLLPIKIEITADPKTIEGETYIIDYEKLGSATKTTSLEIKFEKGTQLIESINAQVTDRGPEIAANAIKAAAMVGRLALGVPGPGGGGTQTLDRRVKCRAGVEALTNASRSVRKAIADFPDKSQELSDRMNVHQARAQLGVMTDEEKRKAADDVQESRDLAKRLADLTNTAAKLDERLTFTAEWHFPEAGEADRTLRAPDTIAAWLGGLVEAQPADLGAQLDRTTVSASLTPLSRLPACDPATDSDKCKGVPEHDGVVYRAAVQGQLKVCQGSASATCAQQPEPMLAATALVPQFGPKQVLRLHNGWGEDNELSATFSAGTMLTARYASKSAPVEKASGLLLDATGQALALADARRAHLAAERAADAADAATSAKAETDALQQKIDVLTKLGELAALQARQSDTTLAGIDSATSELAAQVAVLRLEKERRELLAAIGGQ